jgi:hypothetical protein
LLREEWIQSISAKTMQVVGYGAKARRAVAEHLDCPAPFVPSLPGAAIKDVVEVGITHMKFVWVNSNNWAYVVSSVPRGGLLALTILIVKLVYFEHVLSSSNNVVVELIPKSDG